MLLGCPRKADKAYSEISPWILQHHGQQLHLHRCGCEDDGGKVVLCRNNRMVLLDGLKNELRERCVFVRADFGSFRRLGRV